MRSEDYADMRIMISSLMAIVSARNIEHKISFLNDAVLNNYWEVCFFEVYFAPAGFFLLSRSIYLL